MTLQPEITNLCTRLRAVRESRHLTLLQAAALSNGAISAIALGSYERGDRLISALKIFELARMYGMPPSELFSDPHVSIVPGRISIDLRKLRNYDHPLSQRISLIVENIAKMRSDWNGEVISLRNGDLQNLHTFTGLTTDHIEFIAKEFVFPTVK